MSVREVPAASGVLTQSEVEAEMNRLLGVMEARTVELARLTMEASEAEVEFKKSYALVYTQGAGPVKDREQVATLASLDALRDYRRKDALMKSAQEALRTIRAALDVLRSISANVRAMT